MNRMTPSSAVPMISVPTATLLNLAASAMEMMFTAAAATMMTSAMTSSRDWLAAFHPNSVAMIGAAANEHIPAIPVTIHSSAVKPTYPAVAGVDQAATPLIGVAGQGDPAAKLGHDDGDEQLRDAQYAEEPDTQRPEGVNADGEVEVDPSRDRDEGERDCVEREQAQRPAEFLAVAELRHGRVVGSRGGWVWNWLGRGKGMLRHSGLLWLSRRYRWAERLREHHHGVPLYETVVSVSKI